MGEWWQLCGRGEDGVNKRRKSESKLRRSTEQSSRFVCEGRTGVAEVAEEGGDGELGRDEGECGVVGRIDADE